MKSLLIVLSILILPIFAFPDDKYPYPSDRIQPPPPVYFKIPYPDISGSRNSALHQLLMLQRLKQMKLERQRMETEQRLMEMNEEEKRRRMEFLEELRKKDPALYMEIVYGIKPKK